jgi:hypothetical protein
MLQIMKQLRVVDSLEPLNRFDFDNQFLFHEQIDAVATIKAMSFVNQGQLHLAVDVYAVLSEFKRKTGLTSSLEVSWPDFLVHLERGTDYTI